MELSILEFKELGGFLGGFGVWFWSKSIFFMIVSSCQIFVVWQELVRISSIHELTPLAKQGLIAGPVEFSITSLVQ